MYSSRRIISLLLIGGFVLFMATGGPRGLLSKVGFLNSKTIDGKVSKVSDGDTIHVSANGTDYTVRLVGVNTPETHDPRKSVQCYGPEASAFTEKTLDGKTVQLKTDPTQSQDDKYGRLLAYVYYNTNHNFNIELVRKGYAKVYVYKGNKPQQYDELKNAENRAKKAQKGLWSPSTCNGNTAN